MIEYKYVVIIYSQVSNDLPVSQADWITSCKCVTFLEIYWFNIKKNNSTDGYSITTILLGESSLIMWHGHIWNDQKMFVKNIYRAYTYDIPFWLGTFIKYAFIRFR